MSKCSATRFARDRERGLAPARSASSGSPPRTKIRRSVANPRRLLHRRRSLGRRSCDARARGDGQSLRHERKTFNLARPAWRILLSGCLRRPSAGSIMGKTATAKSRTRVIARYLRIGPLASSKTKKPVDAPKLAGDTALRKRRLPLRIKVLTVQVPADNPYDIGIEKTLEALRQSGVVTKSGKQGKPFR